MAISSFGQFIGAGLAEDTNLTPTAIAGILGNGAVESSNYTQFKELAPGGTGVGAFQWSGTLGKQFSLYAQETGGSISDPQTNLNFLEGELASNPALVANLNAQTSIPAATEAFMSGYEKPATATANLPLRENYASQYADAPSTVPGESGYLDFAMPGTPGAVSVIGGSPANPSVSSFGSVGNVFGSIQGLNDALGLPHSVGDALGFTGIPQAITGAASTISTGVNSAVNTAINGLTNELTAIETSLSHFFLRAVTVSVGGIMVIFGLYSLVSGATTSEAVSQLGAALKAAPELLAA